jgi:peptidoglycan/xylan/chitin deacetylase (PgdA/CDA1 family)
MIDLMKQFAKWHADHLHRAKQIYFSQKRKLKITLVVSVLCALVLTLVTMWPKPAFRNLQQEIGSRDQSSKVATFRFPDEPYTTTELSPDWHRLGSNEFSENNFPMIQGFLQHRMLHFTFDDGPSLGATSRILDSLAEYNLRATFFVVGKQLFGPDANRHRELLKRMEKSGHTVALHSYSHDDLRFLSDSQINRQLDRSERMMLANLGYRPALFRPPYGGRNERTNALLRTRGYIEILWNIAPDEFGARTPWEIVSNFHAALNNQERSESGPGGIVLLHDNRSETADTFPVLMEEIRSRNCVLLSEEGEELWDVVGDLSYFLFYGDRLPDELIKQRQMLAREAASEYCFEMRAAEAPARTEKNISNLYSG